jgi:hypothetical protein
VLRVLYHAGLDIVVDILSQGWCASMDSFEEEHNGHRVHLGDSTSMVIDLSLSRVMG